MRRKAGKRERVEEHDRAMGNERSCDVVRERERNTSRGGGWREGRYRESIDKETGREMEPEGVGAQGAVKRVMSVETENNMEGEGLRQ